MEPLLFPLTKKKQHKVKNMVSASHTSLPPHKWTLHERRKSIIGGPLENKNPPQLILCKESQHKSNYMESLSNIFMYI